MPYCLILTIIILLQNDIFVFFKILYNAKHLQRNAFIGIPCFFINNNTFDKLKNDIEENVLYICIICAIER